MDDKKSKKLYFYYQDFDIEGKEHYIICNCQYDSKTNIYEYKDINGNFRYDVYGEYDNINDLKKHLISDSYGNIRNDLHNIIITVIADK
jgi:hypothetical protein